MSVNVSYFQKRLQEKERELLADMAEREKAARDTTGLSVGDRVDQAVSSEGREEQLQRATSDWEVIEQVREALDRINKGTYGLCVDCGRQIEPERLEAIPWTRYCAEDQRRHDRLPNGELPPGPTL